MSSGSLVLIFNSEKSTCYQSIADCLALRYEAVIKYLLNTLIQIERTKKCPLNNEMVDPSYDIT